MPSLEPLKPHPTWRDRWSGDADGTIVLDLGEQPASDLFPHPTDDAPDPRYRMRMVFSPTSGLLQLEEDPTTPEEVMGVEPAALVRQADLCVADAISAGLIRPHSRVLHYPSPHGGSWRPQLEPFELTEVTDGEADLIIDVHGMMHAADQKAAFTERLRHLADDGVLLFMIHNASAIVREGMWNALKNGHFAYYTTPALVRMAEEIGLVAIGAWSYSLYNNGTTMLAFAKPSGHHGNAQAASVTELIVEETALGVLDPDRLTASLQTSLVESVAAIRGYLDQAAREGLSVAGYGAASRTAALLSSAAVTADDVTMIADASEAKHGRAMPGSRIPIVSPDDLVASGPDRVLLFISDLLPEVRAAMPGIEKSGGRWVVVDPVPTEVDPF
ncbi:class I SAM-dependent methyltransferase [Microbacterium sp. MPKO10]|uniref:class I SAM-dependent methyltransferase n=1 Tax=Microbacterium sp. MPKO10 TaxID=2989818 RepID=UPI002235DD1E|nr:class I SAM-dependent methyltransferase [Microbacterium sp. MPKO10]MCW4458848.1 class I SAM-dependent methyltransferase [Microbacterium sp. MPKO10]